jgi:hypothetical protein
VTARASALTGAAPTDPARPAGTPSGPGGLPLDAPIPYLARVRSYYLALGYETPYEWAHYDDVPFSRLRRPLAACRVAIVTTAALWRPEFGAPGLGASYQAAAKFYRVYAAQVSTDPSADAASDPALGITHVAIDRKHTSGADRGSFFPLAALRAAAAEGRVGAVAPRFFGAPTNRSQRTTVDVDAADVLAYCRADDVDAVVLVPNCPVCHQTVSLIARRLEHEGIATVVMGCARDIVEHVGVPRLLFSDFPLGNGAGRPHDAQSQRRTLALALDLLESATAPRTTVQSPLRWSDDPSWKLDYDNVERLSPDELRRLRAEFDAVKAEAQRIKARDGAGSAAR